MRKAGLGQPQTPTPEFPQIGAAASAIERGRCARYVQVNVLELACSERVFQRDEPAAFQGGQGIAPGRAVFVA